MHSFYKNKDYSLFGVIGNPVSHSMSPSLHNKWLKDSYLDLKANYIKINITESSNLKSVILAMPQMGFVGCNITVPFKEDVFNIITELEEQGFANCDDNAGLIGAVNCLFFNPETKKIEAYNTDWIGYIEAYVRFKNDVCIHAQKFLNLESFENIEADFTYMEKVDYPSKAEEIFTKDKIINEEEFRQMVSNYCIIYNKFRKPYEEVNVLVIGAGGAARSVIVNYGFKSITVANRTLEKAIDLVEHFNKNDTNGIFKDKLKAISLSDVKIEGYDLIINATSLGLRAGEYPDVDYSKISKAAICYDLIYPKDDPKSLTPFLQKCLEAGVGQGQLINGYAMLIGQAAKSFKIWTGIEPDTQQFLS